jgi:hypothetical protein
MQMIYSFVCLIVLNTTVKIKFKIDIIQVRLIILKKVTIQNYVAHHIVVIW